MGRIQLFFSYWAANETLAAIDRLWRRKDITTQQRNVIIATVIKRAKGWSEGKESSSNIICLEVNNKTSYLSREFILHHISADDALHVYTAYDKECEFFVFRDKKLSRQFGDKINKTILVNLAADKDVQKLFDGLDLD